MGEGSERGAQTCPGGVFSVRERDGGEGSERGARERGVREGYRPVRVVFFRARRHAAGADNHHRHGGEGGRSVAPGAGGGCDGGGGCGGGGGGDGLDGRWLAVRSVGYSGAADGRMEKLHGARGQGAAEVQTHQYGEVLPI